jgi:bacterioferritin (cytochrome b1)
MNTRRNLAWKLNWYRQSELEGALLLGRMVRHAGEPALVWHLTRHCADEARHAWLWERTLTALDLPTIRIDRSYQSFYLEATAAPRSLPEVLGLTHIFEQRVHRQFSEELADPDLPAAVRRTFNALMKDEEGHLAWVAQWLSTQPDGEAILERYRAIDEQVYQALRPYRDCIWNISGLGEEMHACQLQ